MEYQQFIESKIQVTEQGGFTVDPAEIHPIAKPHQRDMIRWAINGGQRAIFANFGLGKTIVNLEVTRLILKHKGGRGLIIAPLGVRQEFKRDGQQLLGIEVRYVRTDEEVESESAETNIFITNYERVRDGDISVENFTVVSLDEASCLRSFGSKTFQNFLGMFPSVKYKFVYTATPAPNRFKELIHYAGFLGVMDTGQALTRFFQRDSTQANKLSLYPHMEKQFWLWVASWALFLYAPSDLGYSDEGYELPPLNVEWHRISVDHKKAWDKTDGWGQRFLLADAALGLNAASREKRETLLDRVAYAKNLIESDDTDKHWLLWHDLEDERRAIQRAIPKSLSVYGSQDLEKREQRILDFSDGKFPILSTKPSIAGSGCNFQRHCADNIFVGINYKFNDFYQAIHRTYRFLQTKAVNVHIIYAESEDHIANTLRKKWQQHNEMVAKMRAIVQKYGLTHEAMQMELKRSIGINRTAVTSDLFTAVNDDCVLETRRMDANSVDQIITSIPFGNHYEYSATYEDFGHNEDDDRFFEQMDFLVPELLRILKPGRVAAIHVKDRIMYGNVTGEGMYTVNPFSDLTVANFLKHGFKYMGRITVDTDVVRENNQTYRLGWTENAKDSTKMGVGSNEYVLLFRKWEPAYSPNNTANGPEPVTKDNDVYTRAQWQIDASGTWKSSGNMLPSPEHLIYIPMDNIRAMWKERMLNGTYNYQEHVEIGKGLEANNKLPASFMLFAPFSKHPSIWTDITRMKTLNTKQTAKREQNHICPLQLDVIERLIGRYSNEGELILDPFGGIGSTAYQALQMNRRGYIIELNPDYWQYAVGYLEQAERDIQMPTLFDLLDMQVEQQEEVVA